MNVNQLIKLLQQVKDKDRKVKLSVNDVVVGDFHINDKLATRVYLSNYGEEGYKAQPID